MLPPFPSLSLSASLAIEKYLICQKGDSGRVEIVHETKDLKVRDEIYRLCRELIKLDEPWKFVVI
jgi:hypothetical protein